MVVPIGIRIWNSGKQVGVVQNYQKSLENTSLSDMEKELASAKEYNRELYETRTIDLEQYVKELDLSGNGMMGSLEIPKISLKLPIYHGTSEAVLSSGVGHLRESSLPVGGENVHCILTGHRGLPSAQLFTRLDELEQGDEFSVRVCQKVFYYRVSDISVIEPTNTETVLQLQEGRDLISLVTCTPYGINTHRLIVTGERIAEETVPKNAVANPFSKWDWCFLMIPILFLGISVIQRKRKEKEK